MKRVAIIFFILISAFQSYSQKILIQEGSEIIDKVQRTGLYTIVNLDVKTVEKAWEKKLKDYGKVQSSKGVLSITGAEIPGVTSTPGKVYSIVTKDREGTKIWWAIDLGTSFVTTADGGSSYRSASQILSEFAAECYREDINEQIEDAEKALSKTVKDYEKEVKEGENLVRDVDRNKQEKIDLENRLKENAQDLKQLESDIVQNKKDQESAQKEIEKMKQAVEVVKSKLNQIGR